MHPNPAFRGTAREINIAFARSRGFGLLVLSGETAPMVSHVPFLLDDSGTLAELHLVRSNPIARALKSGPLPATLAISGPEGYISPDWYGHDDQVPTWNYVAVHLTGTLHLSPVAEMPDLLTRQSAAFEARLTPKPPWTMDKMTPDALEKLMRQILPVRLEISAIDGTWKLNQNKPDDARLGAAGALDAGNPDLAALMRSPPREG